MTYPQHLPRSRQGGFVDDQSYRQGGFVDDQSYRQGGFVDDQSYRRGEYLAKAMAILAIGTIFTLIFAWTQL